MRLLLIERGAPAFANCFFVAGFQELLPQEALKVDCEESSLVAHVRVRVPLGEVVLVGALSPMGEVAHKLVVSHVLSPLHSLCPPGSLEEDLHVYHTCEDDGHIHRRTQILDLGNQISRPYCAMIESQVQSSSPLIVSLGGVDCPDGHFVSLEVRDDWEGVVEVGLSGVAILVWEDYLALLTLGAVASSLACRMFEVLQPA